MTRDEARKLFERMSAREQTAAETYLRTEKGNAERLAANAERLNQARKNPARKGNYVSRPSQITKEAPSKRLRKRRRKNLAKPRKGMFPNPSGRPLYLLTIQRGKGKKMHYDGKHFSERPRIHFFPSAGLAAKKGRELQGQFPILNGYTMRVESNFR